MTTEDYELLKAHASHDATPVSAFMRKALLAYMQVRTKKYNLVAKPTIVSVKDENGDVQAVRTTFLVTKE